MSIALRTGEEIRLTADFHWTTFLASGLWAGTCSLGVIGQIVSLWSHKGSASGGSILATLAVGFVPFLYRVIQNKCKAYIITNQRLYVEEGILAKNKKDIPLHKINDLEMSQSIVQRMFGAGGLFVLTGNDKPTRLSNIDQPDSFKNQVSEAINRLGKLKESAA